MKSIKFLFFLTLTAFFAIDLNGQAEMTESSEPTEDIYIDGIVKKRLIEEKRILDYEHVREADLAWERRVWRIVDVREKMNLGFAYPEKPLFDVFREMAENGDINVFSDETFKEPLAMEDLTAKLNRIDTFTTFDYDTYEETIQIAESPVNAEDIKRYRVKEIWYFDEETSTMKSRILGISPIRDVYDDETGEFKYPEPLFWIYYPEARKGLAKHRVYNEYNEIAPMTWFDLFETRMFSSYIIKASNVLDLRLTDIFQGYETAGVDMLLEGDKIKAELFNFEHDLWTY
jgi:gliding motility associated protien GldN